MYRNLTQVGNQPFPCCEAFLFCNTEKTDGKITYLKGINESFLFFQSQPFLPLSVLVKNKILIQQNTSKHQHSVFLKLRKNICKHLDSFFALDEIPFGIL